MRLFIATLALAGVLGAASAAMAHTPLFSCFDNGDSTISCEGGFSDGSSAAGVAVHLLGADGKVLAEHKLNDYSEVTIKKPDGAYSVQFDAGEGHRIKIAGSDIVE
ncbi:MAG: hypothetical protein H0S85_00535 [Desulfovibrionaceae bacterium]|jgi:hypothetical protein|nr:hypothetical protein [Desulfovibrionaceae bacterium]